MITKKEIAQNYGVCDRTISKRIKELGINSKGRITPKQLSIIKEELGDWNDNDLQNKKNALASSILSPPMYRA
jgi:predicted transcriptional regulator